MSFKHKVLDLNNGQIIHIGDKNIYNLDNENSLINWCKCNKSNNYYEFPNGSSSISIKETNRKIIDDFYGFLIIRPGASYIVYDAILTTMSSEDGGNYITSKNILKCLTSFTARSIFKHTWINDKDQFIAPNENHPKFKQFQNDSIIYSLFNPSSQQSSLRNITYHNKKWDIKNEFFWMPSTFMKTLAEKHNNQETLNDIELKGQTRYLNKVLTKKLIDQNEPFSNKAKEVLKKSIELLRDSFEYRQEFNDDHPEYQINNWDCGWYQIKAVCKEYCKDKYEDFRKTYLELRDELRPLVYELGFLKP